MLAADVRAAGDVPPFPCSAMDGYALLAGPSGRRLRIVGESRAGAPSGRALSDGEAIRVSTGAAIPPGADAVIPQEDVDLADGADGAGGVIVTAQDSPAGAHVRGAGEDMRAGTIVLHAGRRLGPVQLGAAVAAGAGTLQVATSPRVAVLCTGDELRAPGEPLGPGEIHNSNAPMLTGLSLDAGADTGPAGRLPDDRQATIDGIARRDRRVRRGDHHRRRLGRPPRPRQAGAVGVAACSSCSGASRCSPANPPGSGSPATARSSSASPATRSRRS